MNNSTRKLTTKEFIEKAKLIHGTRYDYSKVNYINNKTPVNIICKEHGEFWQIPNTHLLNHNCPKCSRITTALKKTSNSEIFIEKAKIVHNNLYDYSLVNYIKNDIKVDIICHKHGKFKQNPADHLSGHGCPICNLSKGELLIYNWLKENNIPFKPQFELITEEIARNSNLIKIDFFVKYQNKQYFIEYDGEQHFKFNNYFHSGGIVDFEKQQRRDKVLNDFCELHKDKITLIRFNYLQEEDEIIKILKTIY